MNDYDINTDLYINRHANNAGAITASVFETHTLFEKIGDVRGKTVVDLCCGDGRLGWMLLEMGAKSVIGLDISGEMIRRAEEKRKELPEDKRNRIRFVQTDLRDSALSVPPADLVTGLYVLHYADSPKAITGMGKLIARTMKPRGRCALVTMNPSINPEDDLAAAQSETGVHIEFGDGPECTMRVGDFRCRVWNWSRDQLEDGLATAGLHDFTWTPRSVPRHRLDLHAKYTEALKYPHCVVFTARRAIVRTEIPERRRFLDCFAASGAPTFSGTHPPGHREVIPHTAEADETVTAA